MVPKIWLQVSSYVAIILATSVMTVLMSAPPASAFAVAAAFPPWWSADDVRDAVEPVGVITATGRTPNVVTVYGGNNLQLRLRKAGAWLILDPRLAACRPQSEFSQ
ncbi:hypothetical protein KOAAANKH_03840 [Brevundimonas sp. NIBR10]|jgi:hypothetical protein|uniref:hypothetical protein n=1 Tax=Brevundimonas sp. NIBR10 TaxID=3015997 RepID=UPI0022F17830|nr:hypothetical protein [Brevundimonas sp. NIBR10]WGM48926.1 hypothetical protein KOAAANKH_03840 [Brevundimonas sp. NIBR10]